jgi:hypothetical protein
MTWTRILSADRVWLRASERISVIDLGIRACSLIFGGQQWPVNCHFAAHYRPNMGVTTLSKVLIWKSFDGRIDVRDALANIFFDS